MLQLMENNNANKGVHIMPATRSLIRNAAIAGVGLALVLPAAPARAGRPVVLTYFLPKTRLAAAVSQRLVSCPAIGKGDVEVVTLWTLAAAAGPDYAVPVRVDASTGFLAKRSVELTTTADGTLTAFNSASEGQGGAVIESVLKVAARVAPLMVGLPVMAPAMGAGLVEKSGKDRKPTPVYPCTAAALASLKSLAETKADIIRLQGLVATGDATAEDALTLAALADRQSALTDDLTIVIGTAQLDPKADNKQQIPTGFAYVAPAAVSDYDSWFVAGQRDAHVAGLVGRHGFIMSWVANDAAYAALKPTAGTPVLDGKVARNLVFRRPVPAVLVGAPCKAAPGDAQSPCDLDESPAGALASDKLKIALPQLAAPTAIPVGSAGIFGSRTVKASFDANGAPLALSYGSDPGAEAIAGTIDAAGETVGVIHDARLTRINDRIALEEAKTKLRDAIKANQIPAQ